MAADSSVVLESLGDRLRFARDRRGLTLEVAAELTRISKSHLSRLESGDRQPSVASLITLAAAYGVSIGTLFGEDGGAVPLSISPPNTERRESNGLAIATCSGFAGSTLIDALRVTVTPERPATAAVRHPGEEWLYVASGTLLLEYGGSVHRLSAGTTAHFDAELPHRLAADVAVAEVLLVAAKSTRNLHSVL